VEISTNDGASWTELARYDQSADPGWEDNVADPTDWRHEVLTLDNYANQQVRIRFRLQSDQLLELDGWYVDNVQMGYPNCLTVGIETAFTPVKLEFLPPSPNPARGFTRFAYTLPEPLDRVDLAIYDVAGRVIRYERLGAHPAGAHGWTWDGRDSGGRSAASGAYFARLLAGGRVMNQRVLKLAP
jgi:hypothetical protein